MHHDNESHPQDTETSLCVCECVFVCLCGFARTLRLTETMRVKKMVYTEAVYTYSLTDKQREAHFIANVRNSVGVYMSVCLRVEKLKLHFS